MRSLKNWRLAAGVLVALCAAPAMAAEPDAPKTREQGQAETREAMRTGNISAGGEVNCKLNEANPSKYPAKPVPGGAKTRDQVKAETREAMRSGEMSSNGEAGCSPQRVMNPGSGKTRAQGKAERDEAIRQGQMGGSGEVAGSTQPPAPGAKKAP